MVQPHWANQWDWISTPLLLYTESGEWNVLFSFSNHEEILFFLQNAPKNLLMALNWSQKLWLHLSLWFISHSHDIFGNCSFRISRTLSATLLLNLPFLQNSSKWSLEVLTFLTTVFLKESWNWHFESKMKHTQLYFKIWQRTSLFYSHG